MPPATSTVATSVRRVRVRSRTPTSAASSNIRSAAEKYLDAVFGQLTDLRVLPRSRYEPWLRVGTDYEGWAAMAHEGPLIAALEAALPWRFKASARRRFPREFGSQWCFSLLHAAVAAATRAEDRYQSSSTSVQQTIEEFLGELPKAPKHRLAVLASDFEIPTAGAGGSPLEDTSTGLSFLDVGNASERALEKLIPGSGYLVDRSDAFAFPGSTAVVWTDTVGWLDESVAVSRLQGRFNDFLTGVRITTGSSAHALVAVWGSPSPVDPNRATIQVMPHAGAMRMTYRPVELTSEFVAKIGRLVRGDLGAVLHAEGDSDLRFAIARLNRVYGDHTLGPLDKLLELGMGLEAALGGPDRADIALRLRLRSAMLLGSSEDPAERVFDAVKVLYDLRSKVVHGDPAVGKDLVKSIGRVRTSVTSTLTGEQLQVMSDRYSDLLRRAVAARLALGAGTTPLWPWQGKTPDIDRLLATPSDLAAMRRRINDYWRRRGIPSATAPATPISGLIGAASAPTTSGAGPRAPS